MTNTSEAELPHTPRSATDVPLVIALHAVPLKWTIAPLLPTAKTSDADDPQTVASNCVVPLATGVQVVTGSPPGIEIVSRL